MGTGINKILFVMSNLFTMKTRATTVYFTCSDTASEQAVFYIWSVWRERGKKNKKIHCCISLLCGIKRKSSLTILLLSNAA